jgi:hypothetical protein
LARTKKLQKCKNQSLANVCGIRQRPVAVAGFRRKSLAGSRPFWPDPAEIFRIRPDQWQDPVISGRLSRNPAIFRPASGTGGRIPTSAGYRRPDVVELQHRLDSDDRQLLNSDNRISNVHRRMKSLISENDLRF